MCFVLIYEKIILFLILAIKRIKNIFVFLVHQVLIIQLKLQRYMKLVLDVIVILKTLDGQPFQEMILVFVNFSFRLKKDNSIYSQKKLVNHFQNWYFFSFFLSDNSFGAWITTGRMVEQKEWQVRVFVGYVELVSNNLVPEISIFAWNYYWLILNRENVFETVKIKL